MQFSYSRLTVSFFALVFVAANTTRADAIATAIDFTWNTTIAPSSISAVQADGGSLELLGVGGAASYFGRPGYDYNDEHAVGETYRTNNFQDAIYNSQPFTLALKLSDGPSGLSQVLTFHGMVIGGGGSYPNDIFWDGNRTVTIGQDIYQIQMLNYWLDGLESYPYEDIFAKIDVSPTSNTPEPSSLLLAAMTLPILGFARWKQPAARTNKS